MEVKAVREVAPVKEVVVKLTPSEAKHIFEAIEYTWPKFAFPCHTVANMGLLINKLKVALADPT